MLNGINTKLYRASNVLKVMSYWKALFSSVMNIISQQLVVVHNYEARPRDRLILEKLLRLCWCNSLPDELLSKRQLKIMRQMVQKFVGNVASRQMLFQCSRPGCVGGAACRTANVEIASRLCGIVLFSRRPVDPTISRWWKCTPLLRVVGCGVCLHALWPRGCPRKRNKGRGRGALPQDLLQGGNDDEHWHVLHDWRSERTWEFFNVGITGCVMVLVLTCLQSGHRIMAWVMSRDGIPARSSRPFKTLGDLELKKKSKPEALLEFFAPSSSPVWSALSEGCMNLHDRGRAAEHWCCVVAYHQGSFKDVIVMIWQNQLPVLAHIWAKLVELLLSWPQRLLLLLSDHDEIRRLVARTFPFLCKCCMPRGVEALQRDCPSEEATLAYDKKVLAKELAWQLDLSIFDREVSHACAKTHIEAANGKAPSFENVATTQFGKEVWQQFAAAVGGPPKRGQGRPQIQYKKRLRYDAWNAYVAANPCGGQKTSRPDIC